MFVFLEFIWHFQSCFNLASFRIEVGYILLEFMDDEIIIKFGCRFVPSINAYPIMCKEAISSIHEVLFIEICIFLIS